MSPSEQRDIINEIKKEILDETNKICIREGYVLKTDYERIVISCMVFNEKFCSLVFRFEHSISVNMRHDILNMLIIIQREVKASVGGIWND